VKKLGVFVVALAGVMATSAVGCGSTTDTEVDQVADQGPVETVPAAPTTPALAEEIAVDEVAVYQGVKATLVREGAVVASPNAPVIANRPAFVRVFVKAIGRTRPLLEAELRVKRAGSEDLVLKDEGKRTLPELDDELLENTFNFTIPAEAMTTDASFSFKVGIAGAAESLVYPADGSAQSFAAKTSAKVRVKLVPVTYEVGGVSLTPDLTDLTAYRDTVFKLYPTASIEMSVRTPYVWTRAIKSNGTGWSDLLASIVQERRSDKPERDVYYVGVFTPAPSIEEFCASGGCVLGLAPLADEREVGLRAAIILGYKNRGSANTLAHELAHAHGRGHAPCGSPDGVDDDFPYGSASIGVWGYDVLTSKLINPGKRYRDFMSYCGPNWVSDYTYKALYERIDIVAKQQAVIDAATTGRGASGTPGQRPSTELRQSFRVDADGLVHEGPAIEVLPGEERGEAVEVSYEGALGKVFATAKGRVRHLSEESAGSIILAPQAPAGATRARIRAVGMRGARTVVELGARAFGR
jgi:hypothetical protein